MILTFEDFEKVMGGQFEIIKTDPYGQRIKPFKIMGNLYYVGDKTVSMHLVDTGEGLILFDTGWPGIECMLFNSIWELGFNPADVKYILHTHGHIDHYGATVAFQKLYGSKTFLGTEDAQMFIKYPQNFKWEDKVITFKPDELLHDNDSIKLGNTTIEVVKSAGHSPGAVSFFFNVKDNGMEYRAGLPGGIGRNTLFKQVYENLHYPDTTPQDFLDSMDRMIKQKVDVWLGSHPTPYHNDAIKKREQMLADPNIPNPFVIDPGVWVKYMENIRTNMAAIVANGCC